MIETLFLVSSDGDILTEKHYRKTTSRRVFDKFVDELIKHRRPQDVPPIIATAAHYLISLWRGELYFLAVVEKESPPMLTIEFLNRLADVFQEYFSTLNPQSIRSNFVNVVQLLDEMMDNGHPFTTEPTILKEMIAQQGLLEKIGGGIVSSGKNFSDQLPASHVSSTPWRRVGVTYSTNEVFFDLIEELICTVDVNGMIVSSEVHGMVMSNCKLSGMPDLAMVFNNPNVLEDVSFHPCVRYHRWEQNRVLSFVPPDGKFKLMSYRVKTGITLPMYCKPQITFSETGGHVNVMVGTKAVGQGIKVENCVVHIPFPKNVSMCTLAPSVGKFVFDPIDKEGTWTIGTLPSDKTPMLEGNVSLVPGTDKPLHNVVVSVDFKVGQFSSSGLRIQNLTVANESYKPYKGMRCITRSNKNYLIRT